MPQLGIDCKAYRNTGTYGSPTWAELDFAKSVNINFAGTVAEVTSRASIWKKFLKGQIDASVSIESLYDASDTDLAALMTEGEGRDGTPMEFAFMDAAIATSGTKGYRITCEIVSVDRPEQLEDGVMVSFELKPSANDGGNDPAAYTVP